MATFDPMIGLLALIAVGVFFMYCGREMYRSADSITQVPPETQWMAKLFRSDVSAESMRANQRKGAMVFAGMGAFVILVAAARLAFHRF